MTKKAVQEAKSKPPSFEQSMDRLETIVSDMEGGELSLEDMIARFEEGQALIKFCSKKLNEVERRIEVLVKQEDGTLATEPFDAPDEDKNEDGGDEDDMKEGELF